MTVITIIIIKWTM